MITEDLIAYIQAQRRKNKADDEITSRLTKAGWYPEDIAEAFRKLTPPPTPVVSTESAISSQPYAVPTTPVTQPQPPVTVNPVVMPLTHDISIGMQEIEKPQMSAQPQAQKEEIKFDPYPQQTARPVAMPPPSLPIAPQPVTVQPLQKVVRDISTPKVVPSSTPTPVTPAVDVISRAEPVVVSQAPVATPPVVPTPTPTPISVPVQAPIIPLTPKVAPVPVPVETASVQPEKIFDEPGYVIRDEPVKPIPLQNQVPPVKVEKPISRSPFSFQSPTQVNPLFGSEELTPTLVPKPRVSTIPPPASITLPVSSVSQVTSPKIETAEIPQQVSPIQTPMPPQSSQPSFRTNSLAANLPTSAVLSTYPRDIVAATPVTPLEVVKSRKNILKVTLRVLTWVFIAGAIAVAVYLFKAGYIPVPFSLVKKDPKVALGNTGTALQAFNSYTATTKATISSPSFANITNGLVTGDRVTSRNTDSITVEAVGSIHKDSLSRYSLTVESSVVKNPIRSDITYTKDALFIAIPNLNPVFGDKAPLPGIISIKPTELESLLSLLSPEIADKIKTADVYHMLSKGIPPYVKNNLSASLTDLVASAHVTTKGEEVIQGVPTTHYEFTFDRADVKEFLLSLLDTFVVTLTPDQKKHVDEALGATTIDAMDVWVGKNDDMTHQYSFSLTTPLSKVLNLEDKGIAGTMVTLTSQTTYSDFNTTPSVTEPTDTSIVTDFVKSNTDQDIKATLEAFKPLARSLYNAEGSYGTRANPTGSCTNPNPSSLFSPVGHNKGAANAVGAIASSMNSLLTLTNGSGSCFSSQTAWAVAFPSMTDEVSSYCVDSAGVTTTRTTPLKGTSCK